MKTHAIETLILRIFTKYQLVDTISRKSKILHELDDLELVSNDLHDKDVLTLTCIVRDEMFFLPAFIDHYRQLGIARFVFLDDNSTDGTREFLAQQSDCMVLKSKRSFNEMFEDEYNLGMPQPTRWINIWVNVLANRYHTNRWGVHVDADEFLRIPIGTKLPDIIDKYVGDRFGAIWATMLDMYPEKISDLVEMKDDTQLDRSRRWYYDARPHFHFRSDGRLRCVYAGSRARLMQQYRVRNFGFLGSFFSMFYTPGYNLHRKAVLVNMPSDGLLISPHKPSFECIHGLGFPLEHYKFTGQLFERTAKAIERKTHWNGSIEYKEMNSLLTQMEADQAAFLGRHSSSARTFDDYRNAGIAIGF